MVVNVDKVKIAYFNKIIKPDPDMYDTSGGITKCSGISFNTTLACQIFLQTNPSQEKH